MILKTLITFCLLTTWQVGANDKIIDLSNGKSAEMIPFSLATPRTQTYGLQTFSGAFINISSLRGSARGTPLVRSLRT